MADFLVLLDAQRTQLDAEDSVAQAETAVNVAVVAIYKALGGVGQPLQNAAPIKVAQMHSLQAPSGETAGVPVRQP